MHLTILGCGTSTGVPVLGCQCSICKGADPKNIRTRCSAAITCDDGKVILIDTATDMRQQLLREKIERVDAVLYTHAHADHILGLEDLRAINFFYKNPIPAYLTRECFSGIKKTFSYIFERDPGYHGSLTKLDINFIDHNKTFKLFDLTITPFQLLHGNMEVTGYRINNIAYATDCKIIPPQSRSFLQKLDLLVLGALHDQSHTAHLTIDEAISEAKNIAAKRTVFIHMSHVVDYNKRNNELPPNVELGFDGLKIEIV